MKNTIGLMLVLLFYPLFYLNSQQIFHDGDRVCFIGNSITQNGEYHHNILLYHTLRYPSVHFKIFNCGVAGDKSTDIINRMDSDILVCNPNIAVVMVGMNDAVKVSDTIAYKNNLGIIIDKLLSKGIQIILQKPTIYDETTVNTTSVIVGKNMALKACGEVVQFYANKFGLKTIDYWQIMNTINNQLHLTDSTLSLLRTDRIHPISSGHLVMAYQFLKSFTIQSPLPISSINIDVNNASDSLNNINCSLSGLSVNTNSVSFSANEKSLPFPIVPEQQNILNYLPFTSDYNTELLTIKNLASGSYSLNIDNTIVGNFTNLEFQKGINLANLNTSPQYQQSDKVRLNFTNLWNLESYLRAISYIRYSYLKGYKGNLNDILGVKAYCDSVYGAGYTTTYSYMKTQLDLYIKYKPIENNLKLSSDSIRDEIYKLAVTKEHFFKIYSSVQNELNNLIKDSSFDLNFMNTYNPTITDYGWSSPVNFNNSEFVSSKKKEDSGNNYYSCTTSLAKDDYNHALAQYTTKQVSSGKYKLVLKSKSSSGGYYIKISTKSSLSTFLPMNLSNATNGINLLSNKIYINPTSTWQEYSCVFDISISTPEYLRVFFQFNNKGTYDIDDVTLVPFSTTSTNLINTSYHIYSSNSSISIKTDAHDLVLEIYNISGILVRRISFSETTTIPLVKGVYIIKCLSDNSLIGNNKVIVL